MNYKNTLDKSSKKFVCPQCDKKTFTKYIEVETGNYLADEFGKCDRLDNCNYHNRPPQGKTAYLIEYLSISEISDKAYKLTDANGLIHIVPKVAMLELNANNCFIAEWHLIKSKLQYLTSEIKFFDADGLGAVYIPPPPLPVVAPSFHESELLHKMYCNGLNNKDNFTLFLKLHFSNDEVMKATKKYFITDWNTSTVFWQRDNQERIRAGKVMLYDSITGKRSKTVVTNWVHSKLKLENFNLKQCLFGLHLINENTTKVIALVEAEKTAIIMSLYLPDYIWLATGSESGFKMEYLEPIKSCKIIAFPDKGKGFESWSKKADDLKSLGFEISVNDILENNANCPDGGDLVDVYLQDKAEPPPPIDWQPMKDWEVSEGSLEVHRIVQKRKIERIELTKEDNYKFLQQLTNTNHK